MIHAVVPFNLTDNRHIPVAWIIQPMYLYLSRLLLFPLFSDDFAHEILVVSTLKL